MCAMVADHPTESRVMGLQRVQDASLGRRTFNLERHLAIDLRQSSQMIRKYDSDHLRLRTLQ